MLKIEHVVTPSAEQMKFIIEGMRNPKNSWERSDSRLEGDGFDSIGENDSKLMHTLAIAGTEHRKFLRMMPIYLRVTAPLYWWAEADTYKVGTVRNSCSFMHKGLSKEFSINDFSIKNNQIYEILNPLPRKSYELIYPYKTDEFRIFTDHNGRTYKVYKNGYVIREAFDYVDNWGTGRTRHIKEGPATIYKNNNGYFIVKLSGRNGGHMPLSRMVADVWCDKHENATQVDHIDGDKGNNSAENLEWVSASENMRRSVDTGLSDNLFSLHRKYKIWKNLSRVVPINERSSFYIDISRDTTHKDLAEKYKITTEQANNLRSGMNKSENEFLFQECYIWECLIAHLNYLRELYLETSDEQVFQQIRCLLPQGYLQTSNIMLNYEVAMTIYRQRKNHKLDEWHVFCDWIEKLPYIDIFMKNEEDKNTEDNNKPIECNILGFEHDISGESYAVISKDGKTSKVPIKYFNNEII